MTINRGAASASTRINMIKNLVGGWWSKYLYVMVQLNTSPNAFKLSNVYTGHSCCKYTHS